jgi:uncharacterized RDD family membrane protein YckC
MDADYDPDESLPADAARTGAGFGRRLAAIAIDWALSIGIALLLFPQLAYGSSESSAATLLIFATEVIILTWLIAASFGQRVLGIVVVRTDGGKLGLGRVVLRTLLICLVIPAVVLDSDGRGLHDRAVDSIALRTFGAGPGA